MGHHFLSGVGRWRGKVVHAPGPLAGQYPGSSLGNSTNMRTVQTIGCQDILKYLFLSVSKVSKFCQGVETFPQVVFAT